MTRAGATAALTSAPFSEPQQGKPALPRHIIRREQLSVYAQRLPLSLISGLCTAAVLIFALWPQLSFLMLALIIGVMGLIFGVSSIVARHVELKVASASPAAINAYYHMTSGIFVVFGLAWGMLPWIHRDHGDLASYLAVLFGCNLVIAISGTFLVSGVRNWFLAMSLPFYGLILIHLALGGTRIHWIIAVAELLTLGTMYAYSRQMYQLTHSLIVADHSNRTLIGHLHSALDESSRAIKEKSRFLATASHDLRQPMHAIALYFAAVRQRNQDAALEPVLEQMGMAISSMDHLFGLLLDLSKLDAGVVTPHLAPVRIERFFEHLENTFASQASGKGLRLIIEPSVLTVMTDRRLFQEILNNLVSNAIKYTYRGTIKVRAKQLPGRHNGCRITVIDTGMGIPYDFRKRIFEEFFQLHNASRDRQHGLGLGLSIVRRLADLLAVDLRLVSRLGRGTAFSVDVPLAEVPDVEPLPEQLALEMCDLSGLVVLVVDDERMVLEAHTLLLRDLGCIVLGANNVESALRELESADVAPHIILTDYRLTGHYTGFDLVDAVVSMFGVVPAIVLSGDTTITAPPEWAKRPAVVLHKPVEPDLLRRLIYEMTTAAPIYLDDQ